MIYGRDLPDAESKKCQPNLKICDQISFWSDIFLDNFLIIFFKWGLYFFLSRDTQWNLNV